MKPFRIRKIVILAMFAVLVSVPAAQALRFHKTEAPQFAQEDLDGRMQDLKDYRGRQVVLYFWATWCPACRTEIPSVEEVYQKYKSEDAAFIGISLDVDRDKLQRFVEEKRITFPMLFDGKGWRNELAGEYGVHATPTYILIDPDGMIEGMGSWSRDLDADLKAIYED